MTEDFQKNNMFSMACCLLLFPGALSVSFIVQLACEIMINNDAMLSRTVL